MHSKPMIMRIRQADACLFRPRPHVQARGHSYHTTSSVFHLARLQILLNIYLGSVISPVGRGGGGIFWTQMIYFVHDNLDASKATCRS